MTTTAIENPILQKTQELCQTLLDQPEVQAMLQRMEQFLANDQARGQYEALMEKGQALHEKQHAGESPTQQEVDAFERDRQSLVNDPVARGFLEAQDEMHRVRDSVLHYVNKTLELGRVPTPEDFESCGSGCGCHH